MERECNLLICVSLIYSFYVCVRVEWLTSTTSFTFEVLILQSLFVLLLSRNTDGLKDQSKYRPLVSPNLMCLFMIPLCFINEKLAMGSKLDKFDGFDDIHLSLGVTAVSVTKFFFLMGKHKLAAIAVLLTTIGYLLVFANFSTHLIFTLSSLLLWKGLSWIPEVAPRSFSYAEMTICLQLGLCFIARIIRELLRMQYVHQDELRLKWIGVTAVIAILTATFAIWIMKAILSVFSLLSCLCVYAAFAIASLGFLTWVCQDNLLWWFWQLIQGDCTLSMLVFSWILFCGITVIWTIGHALQSSLHVQKTKLEDILQYTVERQEESKDKSGSRMRRKNVRTSEDFGDQNYLEIERHDEKISRPNVSFNTRKVFHLFILLVYIPGLLIAPHLLYFASCIAFGLFIIVEAARVMQVPWIGRHLDNILRTFVDERDQGVLFLTHFYLLIGLSLPLWITCSSLTEKSPLKLYSGVLSLGIGDTVACVIGRTFGRHKWIGTNKTVEGTLSSIVIQLSFVYIFSYYGFLSYYNHMAVLLGIVHSALYEAFTDQIDNLVLPLALYPFLCSNI